jgi:hypothetical protein
MDRRIKLKSSLIFCLFLFFVGSCVDDTSKKNASNTSSSKSKQSDAKECDIQGLGDFKIGSTKTDILHDLKKYFGQKEIKKISDKTERWSIELRSRGLYETMSDRKKKKSIYQISNECPDVKTYLLSSYQIADMEIKDLTISFYKDVLFAMQAESDSKLHEALTLKYGTPVIKKINREVKCFYGLSGNTVTHKEEATISKWRNKNILAENTILKTYNSACEEIYGSDFSIADEDVEKTVNQCKENIMKQKYDSEKEERLKKLNKL